MLSCVPVTDRAHNWYTTEMEKYCKTYTIAYNTPIFTAVTQNHSNGKKSRYTAKITVITAIVNS